jgi:hypothetical protein
LQLSDGYHASITIARAAVSQLDSQGQLRVQFRQRTFGMREEMHEFPPPVPCLTLGDIGWN